MNEVGKTFQARVGNFEGPLGLLLQLVEDRKMHISQVSLAAVTDQFVEHIKMLEESAKGELADFILVASTLMLIKSIALLPQLKVTPEESQGAADLERRLRLYQKFKELALVIKANYGQKIIFPRQETKEVVAVFAPTAQLTLVGLLTAAKAVIQSFPRPEKLAEVVVKKVISLEEVITDLANRVQTALKMSFKDFVKDKTERINVIVSFLGMLELVKRGIVTVEQRAHFDDISMETTEPTGVPRYL